MSETSPLKVWLEHEGTLLRLRLARPKANIVDAAMMGALSTALESHAGRPDLRAILLDADGPNFSFGASVEEHLPGKCDAMLQQFHALILDFLALPIPVLVAVRGQCLGGGLELACAGSRLFASPDALFGQPEIGVGVFAPAASCLLPWRIGPADAEDLLTSGRSIGAEEAQSMRLVSEVASDPETAALTYFEQHLSNKSAAVLRLAQRAARTGLLDGIKEKLARVEELYLSELMATRDAKEGLNAFMEKRAARWENC